MPPFFMMKETAFYITKKGPNVLQKAQIDAFSKQHPHLAPFLLSCSLELRLLDYSVFESLCYWIIGQQISARAATSIIERFACALGPITCERIQRLPLEELRALGLSGAKASYIKNTADFFCQNGIPNLSLISSQESVRLLTRIKGIGEWTAQMHLIFCEGKMDILATKDLVVRQGLKVLYRLDETPNIKEANRLSESWGELATIGTLLCWAIKGE